MSSECAFSRSVREALLRDDQLIRLLGGANVFEGHQTEMSGPHINICGSICRDGCVDHGPSDEAMSSPLRLSSADRGSKKSGLNGGIPTSSYDPACTLETTTPLTHGA